MRSVHRTIPARRITVANIVANTVDSSIKFVIMPKPPTIQREVTQ